LLAYCEATQGRLTVIEPNVTETLRKVVGSSPQITLLAEKSQTALPRVREQIDAVLLEGDLNYATVLGDLRGIADISRRMSTPFPLVFFANASWPYARRDMYYDPDHMPEADRHRYDRSGMTPWSQGLEAGLINYPFANAEQEGGARNGVLSAVEDFVNENSGLRLFTFPVNHGLGIVHSESSIAAAFVQHHLAIPMRMRQFLETLELARLNTILSELRRRERMQGTSRIRRSLAHLARRLGRGIIRTLEK
jgi:hypothetical protein